MFWTNPCHQQLGMNVDWIEFDHLDSRCFTHEEMSSHGYWLAASLLSPVFHPSWDGNPVLEEFGHILRTRQRPPWIFPPNQITRGNCGISFQLLVLRIQESWSQCLQSYDCQTPLSFKNFMNTPRPEDFSTFDSQSGSSLVADGRVGLHKCHIHAIRAWFISWASNSIQLMSFVGHAPQVSGLDAPISFQLTIYWHGFAISWR